MAKADASHTKSAAADLCASSDPKVTHKVKDDDAHTEAQQPSRFMDLPPELREIIYTFALYKETRKSLFRDPLNELNLLAGLSKSPTARVLNQVCRTARQESMKVFYSKNTFVVRGVLDPFASSRPMQYNDYPRPCFPPTRPDPLDV